MTLPQIPGRLANASGLAYGEAIRTAEGVTVLPVSRVRRDAVVPLGVFVIDGKNAKWVPAVDGDRIALIGVATGFMAATLTCLAMLRRPPWPDTRISIVKRG